MTKKTKTTIVITTAITTLLWTTAAFANTRSTVQAPKFYKTQSCQTHDSFKNLSVSLLKDGTITKAQEVTIQGF